MGGYPPHSDDWHYPRPAQARPAARFSWLLMLGVWTLVFLIVWNWFRSGSNGPLTNPSYQARAIAPRGDLTEDEQLTINVFKECPPSVVFIISTQTYRDRFSLNALQIPRGAGTGFIYDTDGHIVTNHHVAAAGASWQVTLSDHTPWDAR